MLTETYIGLPDSFILKNKIGVFSNISYLYFDVEEKNDTLIIKIHTKQDMRKVDVKNNFMIPIPENVKKISGVTFISTTNLKVNLVRNRNYLKYNERNNDLNYVFGIYHRGIDTRPEREINRSRSREIRTRKQSERRSRSRDYQNYRNSSRHIESYRNRSCERVLPREQNNTYYQQNNIIPYYQQNMPYEQNQSNNNRPLYVETQNNEYVMNYYEDKSPSIYSENITPRILYNKNFVISPPNISHITNQNQSYLFK